MSESLPKVSKELMDAATVSRLDEQPDSARPTPEGEDAGESLPYDLEDTPKSEGEGADASSSLPEAPTADAKAALQVAKDRDFTERIARFRQTGNEAELRPLMGEFTKRIERQASRYTRNGLDESDVMEAGYTALASTLKEFNTEAGVPFGVLFKQHFGAKVSEQRAQLEGPMALKRKTYAVRSNVLVARDAVQKEQAQAAGAKSAGYTRDRDVERFTLPASFDDAQFGALFDATGLTGEAGDDPPRHSERRIAAWATLFSTVAGHYRRTLPDAPVEALERAATAKTVPIASAPPISRMAMARSLADSIDYDVTMFARRGAGYDPAPSRDRGVTSTREFYEAVARRSGTTPDRARALIESFGGTQSFDATPGDSGGKNVGPALGARLAVEDASLDDDQIEPIIHGLHLVPTVSRVAFVLHTGLDGFRPLPIPQLAHDLGIAPGQAERMVDVARDVFAHPTVREAIFGAKAVKTTDMARFDVANAAAQWLSEREADRAASAGGAPLRPESSEMADGIRVTDTAHDVTDTHDPTRTAVGLFAERTGEDRSSDAESTQECSTSRASQMGFLL
ncbi:MAG: hypothetical protein ACR2M1_07580 [Gemmatimonadaceae bacterium]